MGLHRMGYALRKVDLTSRQSAIRYVESWAGRWHAELREEIGDVVPWPADVKEVEHVRYEYPDRPIDPRPRRRGRRSPLG